MKPAALGGLLKRLTMGRLARVLRKPSAVTQDDPHLLVLLASQALDEGREDQATCLIEAAYAAFDSRSNVTRLRYVQREPRLIAGNNAISLSTV
jgi:hypothetical protein